MARYCANCGTEVDDTAVFCPTCGQPIDQATEVEMPAAPSWPDPLADDAPAAAPTQSYEEPAPIEEESRWAADEPAQASWPPVEEGPPWAADEREEAQATEPPIGEEPRWGADEPAAEAPPPPYAAPPPPYRPAAVEPPPAPAVARESRRREPSPVNLPFTWPVTLSGWLIGGGAMLAVLGVMVGLFRGILNPIDLLLVIALLGIAVTVFFAASLPAIPHLRLATLAIVLVGFGIAVDRIAIGIADVGDVLLILGTAAAAIGAVLLELGRDQPFAGPQS